MEYTIIEGYDKETVIQQVNDHLKEGWELGGNLVVSVTESSQPKAHYHYFQVMIKSKVPFMHG